jgi:tetratricopeptide (TPR) repeat protein
MTPMPSKTPRTSAIKKVKLCMLAVGISCAIAGDCQQSADPVAQARALLAEGKLAQSEAALRAYLSSHPASAEAHFVLGSVLFRETKPVESLAEFTAGARTSRPTADELKIVASDYVLLHDYADADTWFSEVTAESPNDALAWYLLGRTRYNESRYSEAVSSFERALALHPNYVEAENNLGLSYQALNDRENAKEAFQTAINWQGDAPSDPQPFLNLGMMLCDESACERAIPFLSKAATLHPENPKVHEELGRAYEAQRNLPKAQSELEQAVTLAPDASGLHFRLGQIYRQEGLRDRAQHEFEICERLNSTHSSTITPNPFKSGLSPPR